MNYGNLAPRPQYARNELVANWPDWKRLKQMGLELDDDSRHRVIEALKRLGNPSPIGWRSLLERYIEGDVRLHVHIEKERVRGTDVLDTPYLCTTFEWPAGMLLEDSELEFWLADCDVMESYEEAREVKVAMLVDVPEFIENRKRLFGRVLPVRKRLQPLNVCAQTWPDSPEARRWLISPRDSSPRGVTLAGVEDVDRERKLSPLVVRVSSFERNHGGRHVSVGEGEFPNEMVEGRPEIVDYVPDDDAPFLRGRLPESIGVEGYLKSLRSLRTLRVKLAVNFVGVTIDERVDPFVQEAQVHIRSVEFSEMPPSAVGHDKQQYAKGQGDAA